MQDTNNDLTGGAEVGLALVGGAAVGLALVGGTAVGLASVGGAKVGPSGVGPGGVGLTSPQSLQSFMSFNRSLQTSRADPEQQSLLL